jgi:EAL domain-containing protein (putative c-di-GMP-specific phosphodiesterase class I)
VPSAWVLEALERARRRLLMDAVYVVDFLDDQAVIADVVSPAERFGLYAGLTRPLEESLSFAVAAGELEAVGHGEDFPVAWPFGTRPRSYVGAALRLSGGQPFGVLLALSARERPDLGPREVGILSFVADLVSNDISNEVQTRELRSAIRERIESAVAGENMHMVYQPIVDLRSGQTMAVEALARFDSEPLRPPNLWFAQAATVGLDVDLEIAAARSAIAGLEQLPGGIQLSINVSPATIVSGRLASLLESDIVARRIVFELTEHVAVDDYSRIVAALMELRQRHVGIAVDDLGAGAAGLSHLTGLRPDTIKLDASVVRRIGDDAYYEALMQAMVSYASLTGASLVGEGIETADNLRGLLALGVAYGQGFLIQRPCPPSEVRLAYDMPEVSATTAPGNPG